VAQRGLGVAADAVGALGDVRDGDRDQLLGLAVQRALGEDLLAERLEGLVRARRELCPSVRDLAARGRIEGIALAGANGLEVLIADSFVGSRRPSGRRSATTFSFPHRL
jgi:hypothetical protein